MSSISIDLKPLEQLNMLSMFMLQAFNAMEYAEKFEQDPNLSENDRLYLSQSMFKDSIMSYCKCFASAESFRIRLDINNVTKNVSVKEEYKATHKEILNIRNQYIAHNLENKFEKIFFETKKVGNSITLIPEYQLLTPIGIYKRCIKHYALILAHITSRIGKAVDKLQKENNIVIHFE